VCITTNQPDTISNANPNPKLTTKQHAVVSSQLDIATWPMYPLKVILSDVISQSRKAAKQWQRESWV